MKYDLVTKLQKKSQGRFDALKEAVESGDLQQAGLMQAVITSLGDGDPLMVDYIVKSVLPLYGRAAVPWLSQAFNPAGNITDAHRLIAIRRFDAAEAKKLARLAVSASHKDLSREAIRTLKGSKKDTLLILEQTKRRSVDIRRGAFSALEGVEDKRVIAEVSAAFTCGVVEASSAIRFTQHSVYTEVCASILSSLDKKAGTEAGLLEKEQLMLLKVFEACAGHGGGALDKALTTWVQRAIDGFLYSKGNLYGYGQVRSLIESVALSTTPQAQKLLVVNRDKFPLPRMTAIMCAASWHKSFDLVQLFAPYVPLFKSRCYGWFCGCGGDWPCSVLSAVEFALDVNFEAPGYDGRKPHALQVPLIEKIRKDSRWKVARRT
jgi:hypothetical protein